MPVSVLPRALTSFLEIIFWSLFSGKLASILWCLIFMMDLTDFFFLRLNIDENPHGLQWAEIKMQKMRSCSLQAFAVPGFEWWRTVCVGGRIACAGCCPVTHQPRFLTTLKITILLCRKDRINQKTARSLFCNRRYRNCSQIAPTVGPWKMCLSLRHLCYHSISFSSNIA